MDDEKPVEPEYTFDFAKMEVTNEIADLYQEGNFIVGTTSLGTKFRHHIPVGKILNKDKEGNWILQDMILS